MYGNDVATVWVTEWVLFQPIILPYWCWPDHFPYESGQVSSSTGVSMTLWIHCVSFFCHASIKQFHQVCSSQSYFVFIFFMVGLLCTLLTYTVLWCFSKLFPLALGIWPYIFHIANWYVAYSVSCCVWFFVQLIQCLMSLRADVMHRVGLVGSNRDLQYSSFIVCQPR